MTRENPINPLFGEKLEEALKEKGIEITPSDKENRILKKGEISAKDGEIGEIDKENRPSIGFESQKERFEAVLNKFARKMETMVSVLTERPIEEINKLSKEEFKELCLKCFEKKKIVVHGRPYGNPETGEVKLGKQVDLDGGTCLWLLGQAGVNLNHIDLQFVEPGYFVSGAINLDTGNKAGMVIDEEKGTVWFDQHGKLSKKTTIPSSKVLYLALLSKGFFGKEFFEKQKDPKGEAFKKMLKFISWQDRKEFPLPAIPDPLPKDVLQRKYNSAEDYYFETSDKNILGLARFFSSDIKGLYEFFKERFKKFKEDKKGKSFNEVLLDRFSDEELEKYGLTSRSEQQRKIIDQSRKRLKKLRKEGWIIETKFGEVVIDINKTVKGGYDAALAEGLNGYLNFSPKLNSFFLSIRDVDLSKVLLRLNQGRGKIKCVQQNMLIKPLTIHKELQRESKVNLKDIIEALGGKRPGKKKLK